MMKCDERPLPELARKELTDRETAVQLEHLDECLLCRERFRVMRLLELEAFDVKKKRSRPRLLIAAMLFLAVLAGSFLVLRMQTGPWLPTPSPYPHIPLAIRAEREIADHPALNRAFDFYAGGGYEAAARQFRELEPRIEILFFQGVSEYLAGSAEAADRTLLRVCAEDRGWRHPALWSRAHALLLLDRKEEAAQLLREVEKDSGEYSAEAALLLKELGD